LGFIAERLDDDHWMLFMEGWGAVLSYKDSGGEKEAAYDEICGLHAEYREKDDAKTALMGYWLDCVCGCYSGCNIPWDDDGGR